MLLAFKAWLDFSGSEKEPLEAYRDTKEHTYLEQLVSLYSQDLYHFLYTQSDAVLAEDICQKTWLTVVEKSHLYGSQQTPKAWLFRIARNALLDEFKKQNRLIYLEEHSDPIITNPKDTSVYSALYQQISALPFLQKEALSLQLEGFSIKEIAQITQCPTETIKTRIRYAKDQLRNTLGANYECE